MTYFTINQNFRLKHLIGFAKCGKFTSKTLMSKCLISTTKTYFEFVGVSGPGQANGWEWAGPGRWGPQFLNEIRSYPKLSDLITDRRTLKGKKFDLLMLQIF